jgi:membrane protein
MSKKRNLLKFKVRKSFRQSLQFSRGSLPVSFLSPLYKKFQRDNALFLARGLAFDVLVCLIPAVFLLFVLFGFLFDSPKDTQKYMATYMKAMIPFSTQQVIRNLFSVVKAQKVFGVVGVVGLIWTLTRVFGSVRTVLDVVFPGKKTRGVLAGKIFDLKIMFLASLFLLATVVVTSLASIVKGMKPNILGAKVFYLGTRGELATLFLAFFFTVCLFFFLYTLVSSQRPQIRSAFWGALGAGILWEMAKQGFRLYLFQVADINKVYGSFELLFALVFWVYYSCIVFILGAEMVWVWEERKGKSFPS